MILDQISCLSMNCDLKTNMDLQPGDPQGGTTVFPVCGRRRDSIFASQEEDEFCRLAGLSSAPIYAFDEDGDILPQSHPFTPHNSVGSALDMSPSTTQPGNNVYGGSEGEDVEGNVFDTPGDSQDAAPSFAGGVDEREIWLIDDESGIADDAKPPTSPLRRRPSPLEGEKEVFGTKEPAEDPQDQKEQEREEEEGVEDGLKMGTSARAKGVPTIDLHAASIEVVEDYLEDNTGDDQLRDCCSMVVSHPGRRT